jgi:hypothetical protein
VARGSAAAPAAIGSMAERLADLRVLWVEQGGDAENLHRYMTDSRGELQIALTAVAGSPAIQREVLDEAVAWLAEALARAGQTAEAQAVAAWTPGGGGGHLDGGRLAGLGGGRRLHRGILRSAVIDHAEAWWLGHDPDGGKRRPAG